MDWLAPLKRLLPKPKDAPGGLTLATQRTATNLSEIRLRDGVVTLKSGEVRCFLRVTGFTAHHASESEAAAWLQGYARALASLPGNAVLIVRSKPGGMTPHVRALTAQSTALVARYGPDSPLARLAQDQEFHAERANRTETRETRQYVALHSPKGNVARLLAAAEAAKAHLAAAKVASEMVTDRALARALADDWRPDGPADFDQEILWPANSNSVIGVLRYDQGNTHVAPARSRDAA